MADIVDPKTRSRMMAGIKGKDTKPEMLVRKYLHMKGLRFRLHRKDLPGKPDLVFPGRRVVVFVHGCYWHRHEGCPKATLPSSNVQFWQDKFNDNVARDKRVKDALEQLGWRVLIVWECQLSSESLDMLVDTIFRIS